MASKREPTAERLLTVREAAELLGVKPGTVYQWAYQQRIPVVKLFGRRGPLRLRLSDVEHLIQDSVRPARRAGTGHPERGVARTGGDGRAESKL